MGADREVVGVSVDSKYSHLAWINTPRKQGGLGGSLHIPLVADLTKTISRKYGCLIEEAGHTYRGLYIINPKGVLVQATLNDAPVGRNVDETLRLVQAFQYVDEHGEVCPVNWTVRLPLLGHQARLAFLTSLSLSGVCLRCHFTHSPAQQR